jgi:hypothetical protein
MSDESVYVPVTPVPTDVVRYAGETLRKLASSFNSLYFSRYISRLSAMLDP